jgi:hypothetical protein
VQPAHMQLISYLGRSGGYEVAFVIPDFGVGILYVDHITEDGDYVATAYAVRLHGDAGKGHFTARFPGIGEIAVRFQHKGRRRVGHNQRGCKGPLPVREDGFVRGEIKLKGERGYFHVSRRLAGAQLKRTFQLACTSDHASYEDVEVGSPPRAYLAPSFGIGSFNGHSTTAVLYAFARTEGRYIAMRAAHIQDAPPGAELQAGVLEGDRRMAIAHNAGVQGEAGTLLTSLPGEHPASATLSPPAPFHGQAEFLENSTHSHGWTGSLGISFPGFDIPLTGHGYYTSLCVISPLKFPQGCDFVKPKPLVSERINAFLRRPR